MCLQEIAAALPHHGSPGFHLKAVVRAYEREASLNVPPEELELDRGT